mmetsp:Transcript_51441/g.95174  ORF Transcript_51441/g.95174 Transcript_51441/m.95174 type:complete len:373 (+) Transcript_51441:52-1170(+)
MTATKRRASEVHTGKRSKRSRSGYQQCVVDALEQNCSLPPSVCEMLVIMADTSLSAPMDERSVIDNQCVDMIEAELLKVHSQYVIEADEMSKAKEVAVTALSETEAACRSIQDSHHSAKAHASSLKHKLAEVYEDFANKRNALEKVKLETFEKTHAVSTLEAERALLEAGHTSLQKLSADGPDPVAESSAKAALAKCDIEESLRLALSSTFSKPVAERGSFHTKAFAIVEAALAQKLEAVSVSLKSTREDAEVLKAQEDASKEERQNAMNVLKKESLEFKAGEELWHKEKQAFEESSAKIKAAKETLAEKDSRYAELSTRAKEFEEINLESFRVMKSKASKAPLAETHTADLEPRAEELAAQVDDTVAAAGA